MKFSSLSILFLFASLGVPAFAVNVVNVQVEAGNTPLVIPSGTPAIVSVPYGSFIHGRIETTDGVTQVESSLSDFVYMTKTNGYTTTIEFDGVINGNNTGEISLVEESQTTYSLVFTPASEKPTNQEPSWKIPDFQGINIFYPCMVLLLVVGLVVFVKKLSRRPQLI